MSDREDYDPSIIGRRTSDGDYISFREAVKMFATKEELASMHASLQLVVQRVDNLPQRDEMVVRWVRDDEYKDRFEKSLTDIGVAVDGLKSARLPAWFVPALAIFVTVALVVVQHFWR